MQCEDENANEPSRINRNQKEREREGERHGQREREGDLYFHISDSLSTNFWEWITGAHYVHKLSPLPSRSRTGCTAPLVLSWIHQRMGKLWTCHLSDKSMSTEHCLLLSARKVTMASLHWPDTNNMKSVFHGKHVKLWTAVSLRFQSILIKDLPRG